jgi:signal peptidase I
VNEENPAAGEPAGADCSGQPAEAQPPETPAEDTPDDRSLTVAAPYGHPSRDGVPSGPGAVEPASGPPQRGFIAEWAVTIVLLLFVTTNLVQAFVIPTGSMEDTLLVGDHLLVDKLAYSPARGIEKTLMPYQDVRRGDIIVFRYPMEIQQTFVKRCIGVPGDRIHLVDKRLWLNGKPIDEPYVYHKTEFIDPYRDNFPAMPYFHLLPGARDMLDNHVENGEVVVPEGHYFAMGDNRDNSSDSRYWGFVPRANIVGKPLIVYWSYDAPTAALAGPFALDHLLDMVVHFPTKTRWNRTFRLVHGYPLK